MVRLDPTVVATAICRLGIERVDQRQFTSTSLDDPPAGGASPFSAVISTNQAALLTRPKVDLLAGRDTVVISRISPVNQKFDVSAVATGPDELARRINCAQRTLCRGHAGSRAIRQREPVATTPWRGDGCTIAV